MAATGHHRTYIGCIVCGRPFTTRGMSRHINSAHPGVDLVVEVAHAEALEIQRELKADRPELSGTADRPGMSDYELNAIVEQHTHPDPLVREGRRVQRARGACQVQEPSVPEGGYPSPYAVATLATLIRRQHCLGRPDGVEEAVEELEGRGFVARIPGVPLVGLTEAGKEFTRRWLLSS